MLHRPVRDRMRVFKLNPSPLLAQLTGESRLVRELRPGGNQENERDPDIDRKSDLARIFRQIGRKMWLNML